MGTASFLGGGRTVPTVVTASPPGSSPRGSQSVGAELSQGVGEIMQGRLTLIMLDTLMLGLILFYLGTRRAQGGG